MNKIAAVDLRFILLAAMLVFLPGIEALKNIFALLFVLSWAILATKNNDWGGKWRIIDTIFLFWLLADILVSINAVITHQLSGANYRDVMRFVLIAWALSRIYFPKEKIVKLALLAIASTIVTLSYSYYSAGGVLKELHSVGHINHTAIFLIIAYSLSLSLLLVDFLNLKNYQKIILLLSTIILFLATLDTGSRAAFGLIIVITFIDITYVINRSRKLLNFILFGCIILFIGTMFYHNPPQALKRILGQKQIMQDYVRGEINNFSYYAFKKNPFLGVGFGNYGQIEIKEIKSLIIEDKGVFDSSKYISSSHAHNVYFNYLVSGGALLFSIFLWFWFYIVWIIFKLRSIKENQWIVLCSVSVLLINLGIGWVNTTLHHEHAILSMFILGLLISQFRQNTNFDS